MAKQNLTNELCGKKVTEREKHFDAKVGGLYASITKSGCKFHFKYYDRAAQAQRTVEVGSFDRETFDVAAARRAALKLKSDAAQGVNVSERARTATMVKAGEHMTFDAAADAWLVYLQTPVKKRHGIVARRESWQKTAGYLRRPRAAFGKKAVAQVTDTEVAQLLEGIIAEDHIPLSVNVRSTLHGFFRWCAEPARKWVPFNPCTNLGERPEMVARERSFSHEEIATFWHKLDAIDCPCPRTVALALKLMLCTGLRGGEVCGIQREWLVLDGANPHVRLPASVCKNRKPNYQPLNVLAVAIVKEALAMSDATTGALFPAGKNGAAFNRHMLTDYMHDRGYNGWAPKDGVVRQHGLLGYLGFEAWRPHDLRHTVAVLLRRSRKVALSSISEVLSHTVAGNGVAQVTIDVYAAVVAEEAAELKRPTLDVLAELLTEIIAPAPATNVVKLGKKAA